MLAAMDKAKPERKPYTRPALTNHGKITRLTAGGSGTVREMLNDMDPTMKAPLP
jgi:hypothetical protein